MKDQTEFEIELHNPTKEKIMAMIEMNGTPISDSGIILKPGQRVFLERFLDNEKKFLYETYVVNNNKETKEAIQNNGKVTVRFHKESKPRPRSLAYGSVFNGSSGFGWSEIIYTDYKYNPSVTFNTNTGTDIFFTNTSNFANTNIGDRKMETGSVEQGSQSNQELKSTHGNFEWFYTWTDEWQIMPHSQQPVQAKDLVDRCVKCKTKLKSNHKFCPECGEKNLGKQDPDEFLQSLTKEQLIELLKAK
jgi:NADH pyrophosphatase NudC (nudix superfamily)